jgi:hypothetical protein
MERTRLAQTFDKVLTFLGLALLGLLASAQSVVVLIGAYEGEIKTALKYSKEVVRRSGDPIRFWSDLTVHFTLALFLWWLFWFMRKTNAERTK